MANRRVEAVTDFTSLVFKIFADGYCSREIKGCLLLTSKAVTNLGRVLKSRELVLWSVHMSYTDERAGP